jgi:coiled-coil domain-containing protein 55
VKELQQKALEEDPTVFDYDGVYDSMVAEKQNPRMMEKVKGESKYIGLLLQQKVVRDKEQDISYERRLVRIPVDGVRP